MNKKVQGVFPSTTSKLLAENNCSKKGGKQQPAYELDPQLSKAYKIQADKVFAKDKLFGHYATAQWLNEYQGRYVLNSKKGEVVCHIDPRKKDNNPIARNPSFEYREIFSRDGINSFFAINNYLNPSFKPGRIPKDLEFKGEYLKGWNAHTFRKIIAPDKYFKTSPEYFAFNKAKNKRLRKGQLCLSNEQVIELTKKTVRDLLRETKHEGFLSISQNDGNNLSCECDKCTRINTAEGSKSATLILFVNEIAASIQKEFPKVKLSTLAYFETLQPPKSIKLHPNVYIKVCTNDFVWDDPMIDIRKTNFPKILDGWKRLTNNILIWDYSVNFQEYLLPLPNVKTLSRNLDYYHSKGVKGVFIQSAHDASFTADVHLKSWVWAQKMWNIELNTQELIEKYCKLYYESVGGSMIEYYRLLETLNKKQYRKENIKSFYPRDFILRAQKMFSAMEKKEKSNPKILGRIKDAKLPLLYISLKYNSAGFSKQAYKLLQEEFQKIAKENKYFSIGISKVPLENTLNKWESTHFSQRRSTAQKIFIEESDMKIVANPKNGSFTPSIVKDAMASNKFSLKIPGGNQKWLSQINLDKFLVDQGKYKVSVRLRSDSKTTSAGNTDFGIAGVYKKTTKEYKIRKPLKIENSRYQVVYLGDITASANLVFYFKPNAQLKTSDFFFVDYVLFEKK